MGWTLSFAPLQWACCCTSSVEGAGGTMQRKGPLQGRVRYCVSSSAALYQWLWVQTASSGAGPSSEPGATTLQCTQSLSLVTTLPWPFRHGHMHHPARRPAPSGRTPPCARLPASTCLQPREVFLARQPWLWLLTGWLQFTFNPTTAFSVDQLWPGNPTNFSATNWAMERPTPTLGRSGSHLGSSVSGIRAPLRKWSGVTRGAALNKVCLLKYTSSSSLPLLLESRSPAASRTRGKIPLGGDGRVVFQKQASPRGKR